MASPSLKELEMKNKGIKGYKSIPIDKLLNMLDAIRRLRC